MKRKKRNKSVIVRLLVLGVCVYMIATIAGLWNTLNESKNRLANLEKQYASEKYEIDELKAILESDSDNKIIEKAARERLGYAYPDEKIYKDMH